MHSVPMTVMAVIVAVAFVMMFDMRRGRTAVALHTASGGTEKDSEARGHNRQLRRHCVHRTCLQTD